VARQLLLMRHAKSDWDADFETDHERPLNERGVRSARLMGRFLAANDLEPDHVISSTAVRARRTAELAAEAGSWRAEIALDRAIYDTAPGGVIERARRAPNVYRLMLIGHQPTWGGAVAEIAGETVRMKTATVAVIDLDVASWDEIGPGRGNLVAVHHPRDYFASEWDES
jgi:phosphohistidine phosphatase